MAHQRPVVWISHRDGEACAGCGAALGKGRIAQGREPFEVRPLVRDQVDTILTRWQGAT